MAEFDMKDSPDLLEEPANGGGEEADHPMLDAEKPINESDSESDSDSDGEEQVNLEVANLENELTNNPSNYDAHVQYIRALRKQGDLDKLKQAREAMSDLFPLSPILWREWVRDETALDSRPEALSAIVNLYERGVSDYLSVSLWLEYANFLQEYDPSARECSTDGISKVRNIFERAVTAAGLHVVEGSRIYEAYREFEQAILLTLGEADTESREKQVQRIRNMFFRQLSVPLVDLETTLLKYKAWEAEQGSNIDFPSGSLDGLPRHVVSSYQKALEMLKARSHFEEQIATKELSDTDRIQQFMVYLKYEKSAGDPARVQVLYERAITEFPICTDLWLDYTSFLDRTIKTSSVVRNVYARCVRNCPWVGELWSRYLLHIERIQVSDEELSVVFEKSLQCTFSSYEEYLDIFLTRVDGLRRKVSSAGEVDDTSAFSLIRETCQRASDYLSPNLKNSESLLRLYRYWAQLELNMGKDINVARAVWESFLKISGPRLETWLDYTDMEIRSGHIAEARSLYKRCYSKRFSGTGSEEICHSWVRFEREYGSLEDLDFAVQKVTSRMEELQLFKMQQEGKNSGLHDHQENTAKKSVREKRKMQSNLAEDLSPAKRKKGTADLKMTEEKGKNQSADSGDKNKMAGDQVTTIQKESGGKRKTDNSSPGKSKHYNDQCTAFISNLNPQATYENIRAFFSDVGGVVGIRILTDKFTGKSRGLAYVDFSDEAHLNAGLAKNKRSLLGKKLSILKSDPKNKRRGGAGQNALPKQGSADNEEGGERSNSKDASSTSIRNTGSQGESSSQDPREDGENLSRRNLFLPRAVRPLGWSNRSKPPPIPEGAGDEIPKSNDEFRNMLLKKT